MEDCTMFPLNHNLIIGLFFFNQWDLWYSLGKCVNLKHVGLVIGREKGPQIKYLVYYCVYIL